jgi:hypothetical protein
MLTGKFGGERQALKITGRFGNCKPATSAVCIVKIWGFVTDSSCLSHLSQPSFSAPIVSLS